jgi:hypothetical protein
LLSPLELDFRDPVKPLAYSECECWCTVAIASWNARSR